jgi:Cof subfamily protein (haloacid dehalogenase superfamily)
MIKAIFFDVDGTLLSHKIHNVPESTRQALREVRKKGIRTVIATGRDMVELSKLPVMDMKFDGYLTLNGQLCLDETKHAFGGNPIDSGEAEILVNIFKAKKIPFVLIGEGNRYINYVDNMVVDTQKATAGTIPDIGEYHGEKIYQCIAFVGDHEREMLSSILDECKVTSWNKTGIDIIAKEGGKSVGIQKFLEEEGMDRSEIMAFGDGENDVDMLKFAGIGVAMGNGAQEAKDAADYVTDSVDADGIAKALRHFGLIA